MFQTCDCCAKENSFIEDSLPVDKSGREAGSANICDECSYVKGVFDSEDLMDLVGSLDFLNGLQKYLDANAGGRFIAAEELPEIVELQDEFTPLTGRWKS